MLPPLSIFPVTLLRKFSHRVQAHILLQTQPPLQSQTCSRPNLSPKRLKVLDVPIHLSCHFSVRTNHWGTLQTKLGILVYFHDQYLSTSNGNLSSTQSPNIKILFKCDMSIGPRTTITAVGHRDFTNLLQE